MKKTVKNNTGGLGLRSSCRVWGTVHLFRPPFNRNIEFPILEWYWYRRKYSCQGSPCKVVPSKVKSSGHNLTSCCCNAKHSNFLTVLFSMHRFFIKNRHTPETTSLINAQSNVELINLESICSPKMHLHSGNMYSQASCRPKVWK